MVLGYDPRMNQLLATVVPLSLGAAVSPTVLGAIVLILASATAPRLRAWAAVLGMTIALVIVTIAFYFAGQWIAAHRPDPVIFSAVDAVAGVLLIVLGIRDAVLAAKHVQPKKKDHHTSPKPNLLVYLGLGFVLIVTDVTSLVLYVPAMKDIVQASIGHPEYWLVAIIPVLCVLAPGVIPTGLSTVAPGPADRILNRLNDWVSAHTRLIAMVICFGFGIWLAWKGFNGLIPALFH